MDKRKFNWELLIFCVLLVAGILGVDYLRESFATDKQKEINRDILDQITEIKLRMQKNGLLIKGVQRIIDSIPNNNISSEESFNYAEEIVRVANRYETVTVSMLTSLIYQESRFNYRAISKEGARGLGQIMPETLAWICREWNMNCNIKTAYNPIINIRMTAWYLDWLYKNAPVARGDWGKTLAYYNGGGRQAYRWGLHIKKTKGITLDSLERKYANRLASETKDYVYKVMSNDSLFRNRIDGVLPSG